MRAKTRMEPAGTGAHPKRGLYMVASNLQRFGRHDEVIEAKHAQRRVSRMSRKMSCAAVGMLVPGPKIAFTPALRRKS